MRTLNPTGRGGTHAKPLIPGHELAGRRAIAMNLAACPAPAVPWPDMPDDPYCFSVFDKPAGTVLAYTNNVLMLDVEFVVKAWGFRKIATRGRRTVFAWTVGEVVDPQRRRRLGRTSDWVGVTFNPFKHQTFLTFPALEPLHAAAAVYYDSPTRRGIVYRPRRIANPAAALVDGEDGLLQLIDTIGGPLG